MEKDGRTPEQWDELFATRKLSRRELVRVGAAAGGALTLGGLLAACGGDGDEGGATAPAPTVDSVLNDLFGPGGEPAGQGVDFKDGMILAVTGQGSFYGDVMSQGAKLAAKQIEAAGGPHFEISITDHKSGQVPAASEGARKLINEGVTTIQASYGAPTEAIVPLLQQNEVLTFNGGGASPGQLFKDFLWMTRMIYAADPGPGGIAYLAQNSGAKKLAVIGQQENGIEVTRDYVPKVWPELVSGGEIVANEVHDVGITDFSSIVAKIRSSGAEAVFTTTFGNDLGYEIKQLREAGVDIPLMSVEYTEQAREIAGDTFEGYMFCQDFYDPENPNPFNAQFVKAHEEEYGTLPEFYGSNYYEHVFIIWDLIRRVIESGGDVSSGPDLQDALKADPSFKSIYGGDSSTPGEMTFDLEDHTISKPMGVFVVENGKPKLLAPIRKISADEDPTAALEV